MSFVFISMFLSIVFFVENITFCFMLHAGHSNLLWWPWRGLCFVFWWMEESLCILSICLFFFVFFSFEIFLNRVFFLFDSFTYLHFLHPRHFNLLWWTWRWLLNSSWRLEDWSRWSITSTTWSCTNSCIASNLMLHETLARWIHLILILDENRITCLLLLDCCYFFYWRHWTQFNLSGEAF